MTTFMLYVVLKLDLLCFFCTLGALFSFIICAVTAFVAITTVIEKGMRWNAFCQKYKGIYITIYSVFFFFITSVLLIPNTKQATAIYLLPKIINNEQAQKISKDSLEILEKLTTEYLKELKKNINKTK